MWRHAWFKKNGTQKVPSASGFVRLDTPPAMPGSLPIQSAAQLLQGHTSQITHLAELAGLSKPHFHRFYIEGIQRFARLVQQCPASEVHHHAGPGGMLSHTLDTCVIALKIRQSYLLSETGSAEEIAEKQDSWTYAVFLAALCHDLAKVAVDQVITLYDRQRQQTIWDPWSTWMDEHGAWYTTEFVRNRQYRLHEKASPLLTHRIIPDSGMAWLSSDPTILARWLACVSGDLENAAALGEIVTKADRQSVAANLGADTGRVASSNRIPIPLHEKMLTALRFLLTKGTLPLNRNGAAGWIQGEDCWLVSKRTVDAIRDQLIEEGHSGIPSKNTRLFDVLQEHRILVPQGEGDHRKAIWIGRITGDGWSNELTLIRIPVAKLWPNPDKRPAAFQGTITPLPVHQTTASSSETDQPDNTDAEVVATPQNSAVEATIDHRQSLNEGDPASDTDVLSFLPSHLSSQLPSLLPLERDEITSAKAAEVESHPDHLHTETQEKAPNTQNTPLRGEANEKRANKAKKVKKATREDDGKNENHVIERSTERSMTAPSNPPFNAEGTDDNLVNDFIGWLQTGIQTGHLKINQPKARLHVVEDGLILVTPGIFQDYTYVKENDRSNWLPIQKKVLKQKWHVRDDKGLNVIKYQVKGHHKSTTVNAILFDDVSSVLGEAIAHQLPGCNPHLTRMTNHENT